MDGCHVCRGTGRLTDSPPCDYSPTAAPITGPCWACVAPEVEAPRRSADDELAAYIAAQKESKMQVVDDDAGRIAVWHGDRIAHVEGYDVRNRDSLKAAVRVANAYRDGWAAARMEQEAPRHG